MTKRQFARRLTWVGLALSVVVLAFGLTTRLLTMIPGVTEDNVRRIHIGMSAKQVESIMGEPTEDGLPFDAQGWVAIQIPRRDWKQWLQSGSGCRWEWLAGKIRITIFFSAERQVFALSRESSRGEAQPDTLTRLFRWGVSF